MTENQRSGLDALHQRKDAIFYTASHSLHEAFPDTFILETEEQHFDPDEPGPTWKFRAHPDAGRFTQLSHSWHFQLKKPYLDAERGWFQAEWNGKTFDILRLSVSGRHCDTIRWYVLGKTKEDTEGFFSEVCNFHSTLHGEILVFNGGRWSPSKTLYNAIKSSSLEDLILEGNLKESLVQDVEQFLAQEAVFKEYQIAWKRGILLLGPPGNGKTHLIRALAGKLNVPCLYVKTFEAQYMPTQQCMGEVFRRAREMAPCLLVLEDLDTLLTPKSRSFFLNEMDGFASNHGIVTIATCNFPDKLDPAITDRPSRFDRKYHFNLPAFVERKAFLARYQFRFDSRLQLDEAGLETLAHKTDGYSFAYLKELCVSSVVRWFSTEQHRPVLDVMVEQASLLRSQMATDLTRGSQAVKGRPPESDDEEDDNED